MEWLSKVCEDCGQDFQTTSKRFTLCKECRRKPEHQSYMLRYYYAIVRRPRQERLAIQKQQTEAICPVCRRAFRKNHKARVYCSAQCKYRAKHPLIPKEQRKKPGRSPGQKPKKETAPKEAYTRICPQCHVEFETNNARKVYCSKKCGKRAHDKRKPKRERQAKESSKPRELPTVACKACGLQFQTNRPYQKYCSAQCSGRMARRGRGGGKLRHRLRKHGVTKRDYGLTLNALYRRDKGRCYICGRMTDKKDCRHDEGGNFITGDKYPTIDHIAPISKGGTHTWDNVGLACKRCNSLKSNNTVFDTATGQMRFAV